MKISSHSGWLMSLREDPLSNWGSVESFVRDVRGCPVQDGWYILESDVWGKMNVKEPLPQKGHGIGFYHSTRARFPERDRYGRKPRLTVIGGLLDVEIDGRDVTYIKAAIAKDVLEFMSKNPIVRDESTSNLFEGCGIKQGSVATFYYADPVQWKQIVALFK